MMSFKGGGLPSLEQNRISRRSPDRLHHHTINRPQLAQRRVDTVHRNATRRTIFDPPFDKLFEDCDVFSRDLVNALVLNGTRKANRTLAGPPVFMFPPARSEASLSYPPTSGPLQLRVSPFGSLSPFSIAPLA